MPLISFTLQRRCLWTVWCMWITLSTSPVCATSPLPCVAPWWTDSTYNLVNDDSEYRPDKLCSSFTENTGCQLKNFCCFQSTDGGVTGYCIPSNTQQIECPPITTDTACSMLSSICWWDGLKCRRRCPNAPTGCYGFCSSITTLAPTTLSPSRAPSASHPTSSPFTYSPTPINATSNNSVVPSHDLESPLLGPCFKDADCAGGQAVCFTQTHHSNFTNTTSTTNTSFALDNLTTIVAPGVCFCPRDLCRYPGNTGGTTTTCLQTHSSYDLEFTIMLICMLMCFITFACTMFDLRLFCRRTPGPCTSALVHACFFLVLGALGAFMWWVFELYCLTNPEQRSLVQLDTTITRSCILFPYVVWFAIGSCLLLFLGVINFGRAISIHLFPPDYTAANIAPRSVTLWGSIYVFIALILAYLYRNESFFILIPILVLGSLIGCLLMMMSVIKDRESRKFMEKAERSRVMGVFCIASLIVTLLWGAFALGAASFVLLGVQTYNTEGNVGNDLWTRPAHWTLRGGEFLLMCVYVVIGPCYLHRYRRLLMPVETQAPQTGGNDGNGNGGGNGGGGAVPPHDREEQRGQPSPAQPAVVPVAHQEARVVPHDAHQADPVLHVVHHEEPAPHVAHHEVSVVPHDAHHEEPAVPPITHHDATIVPHVAHHEEPAPHVTHHEEPAPHVTHHEEPAPHVTHHEEPAPHHETSVAPHVVGDRSHDPVETAPVVTTPTTNAEEAIVHRMSLRQIAPDTYEGEV